MIILSKAKRGFPVFYCIYFLCIALFLAGLYMALGVVREYLADYESAQPQYEAERVFETYYSTGDYEKLVHVCEADVTAFEDQAVVAAYLREFTAGKEITYNSITTGLASSIKYIVKADGVKFSAFTLVQGEETTPKGVPMYTLGNMEIYTSGQHSFSITAPKGYTVRMDGHVLDASYRTEKEEKHDSCHHMPEGIEGIIYVEYRVDGLYYSPKSVEVINRDGISVPVVQDDMGNYSADFIYSDSLQAEHSEYVIAAAQALAAYMQNDGKFSAIGAYLDPASDLYTNVRSSETYFVISHSSYSFEDVKTSEFYAYDDNTFSCRVSFTHVLKRYGSKDYKDYLDMTFYLRKVDGKYLIYDRYNH